MPDYYFSIDNRAKTVKFYDMAGNDTEKTVVTVHVMNGTVLNSIPESINNTIPPGSFAYSTGMGTIWQKGFDGEWVEVEQQ